MKLKKVTEKLQNQENKPKFIDIINNLKNDPGYITKDVDKNSYFKYANRVDNNKDADKNLYPNNHHY